MDTQNHTQKPNTQKPTIPNFHLINKTFFKMKEICGLVVISPEEQEREELLTEEAKNFRKFHDYAFNKISDMWNAPDGSKEKNFARHILISFISDNASTTPTEQSSTKPYICAINNFYLLIEKDVNDVFGEHCLSYLADPTKEIPTDIFKFVNVFKHNIMPIFSHKSDRVLSYPAYMGLTDFAMSKCLSGDVEMNNIVRKSFINSQIAAGNISSRTKVFKDTQPKVQSASSQPKPLQTMGGLDDSTLSMLKELKSKMDE